MASKKSTETELQRTLAELEKLTQNITVTESDKNSRAAKVARRALDEITSRLSELATSLDPVRRPASIFDPTNPTTAGRVVALTLVAQEQQPLANIDSFYGAGVYAIYYKGNFSAYTALSGKDHPIYVGKADPDDPTAKDAIGQGTKLFTRLADHAKSIGKATSTLDIKDFSCRFLIVQSGFQKSAEDYLIHFFKPIWNSETKICFGLGKHGDSSETRGNKRSPWDTMHPGRAWADSISEDQKSSQEIEAQIAQHLSVNKPYNDIHEIFDRFIEDMRQLSSKGSTES